MHRPKNPALMVLLVALLIGFTWLIHFFVYYSLGYFIGADGIYSETLAIIFLLLWLSFPLATLLAKYYDNRRTRYFYYLSAVWLGVLQYLTLSFAWVWLILYIANAFDFLIPMLLLASIAIASTIGIVMYGISNARVIRTKRIDVYIKNLPDQWNQKKIALVSDVHIGHILRSNFLKRIVKRVNREKFEMLCIAGDLFDGMDGNLEHLFDPLNNIQTTHGIFYADGNHETYLGVERALKALENVNIHILRDEIVHIDGLDIIGIDYPEVGEHINVAERILSLKNYNKNTPSILLFHTPFQIDKIAKTGVDLELCGHTHKGQMWPFGIITKILFRGRDYGLTTIGDYNLYTSSGIGTWGPPLRVGSISEFVAITLHKK